MRAWTTITSLIGRGKSFLYRREERLGAAYRAVFTGSPSEEDQQLVLVDLQRASGFNQYLGADVPDTVLRYQEGMRALYGRIFSYLNLAHEDVEALETAARKEAALFDQE